MSLGLYGSGMPSFILDEIEFGTRVAMALENEALGFGALFDLSYSLYRKKELADERRAGAGAD